MNFGLNEKKNVQLNQIVGVSRGSLCVSFFALSWSSFHESKTVEKKHRSIFHTVKFH